ncbi:MAG TPA: hypothetical protein VGS22_10390 [Thermoanaerobaculia bacterium]|jgi:hypothetical protein|nr:hypothetical protein [Thermoanaerobaculia bacterium]
MNAKATIALAAAFGGASPNLLRLAHDLSEKSGDKFSYLGSTFSPDS